MSVVHPKQVGKQGIIQYFTLLIVRKIDITNLLRKITWNNKSELERNIHFTKKGFYAYKSSYVSVQNFE